ncbi:MAG: phage holin, LLH family [Bacillota bacterium]
MDWTPVYNAVINLLAALIGVAAVYAIGYLRTRIGAEKFEQLRMLSELAVKYAEQAFPDLKGEAKYEKAAEWLAVEARKVGVRVTETQVRGLIEATLRELKDVYGENCWAAGPNAR